MDKIEYKQWMMAEAIDYVFIDVDSTLTGIEGIDVLAEHRGVGPEVKALTEACMSVKGMNIEDYDKRLKLVKPSLQEVHQLAKHYTDHLTDGASIVIRTLQELNKNIILVSGGIKQAILPLADRLNIPEEHVFAVDLYFDKQGHYIDFDHHSPLVAADGKRVIIEHQTFDYKSSVFIGDGKSDLEAQSVVGRFIGFGGKGIRQAVLDGCNYFIKRNRLHALLPLSLTYHEMQRLNDEQRVVFQQGWDDIINQDVIIKGYGYV